MTEPETRDSPWHRAGVWRVSLVVVSLLLLFQVAGGLETLDAKLAYGPSDVGRLLKRIGAHGRERYVWVALIDLCFIAAYAETLRKFFALTPRSRTLPFFAVCALAFFDVVETTMVLVALLLWPKLPVGLTVLLTASTPLKWLSAALTLALVAQAGWQARRGLPS